MARRSKRERTVTPEAAPNGRGSRNVAAATREVVRALPNLNLNTGPRYGKRQILSDEPAAQGSSVSSRSVSVPARAVRPRGNRRDGSALNLNDGSPEPKRDKTCKSQPRNTSGNGAGRPFVPWCKK